MPTEPGEPSERVRAVARAAGVVALLVGGGHLVAWGAGVMARAGGGTITMKTNAALGLLLSGISLMLLAPERPSLLLRRLAQGLATVVVAIGAATLSEHIVGWNLGIDELLATEPVGAAATVSPNRMGPPGSLSFVLLGTALLLLSRTPGRRRPALHEPFALALGLLALLSLTGYLYGVSALYQVARYTGIAWPTALTFLVMAAGVLCARPRVGVMARVTADDPGGALVRVLLGPMVLLPLVLGWVRIAGERVQWFDSAMGTGLTVLFFAVTLVSLLLVAGGRVGAWTAELARREREAREAGEALRESEAALREADRRKDEFLAILSHELRNPLAPVRAALSVLERAVPGSEQANRARTVIDRQIGQLTRLVDDLLDVTRITRGKIQLKREPIDLAALVRRTAEDHRGLFSSAGVDLHVEVADEPLWLLGDPQRLAQVVGNLLHNAAKFTDRGGRTIIAARRGGPAEALVTVTDTGIGIDPPAIPQLFEPFIQVEHSLDRARGGLGLGLALVKSLVDMHRGSVTARSEGPGRGTEFAIRLPLQAAPAQALAKAASPGHRSRRVLIVEDNADGAETLRMFLELVGHEVQLSADGTDGIEKSRQFRPEVVLCDIGLPGLSGYEVARLLRSDPTTSSLYLVALSGYALPEDVAKARAAGFDLHLAKPFSPEKLQETLAALDSRPRG